MAFRHLTFSLRVFLLILAVFLIFHGIWGPQFAPKNLTALFVWVHYRGLLVLAILFFGNVFCGSCPLVFSRNILRRWVRPTLRWPQRLRNKWLSVFLLVAVLFAYESFDLWASPRATAFLIIGYFVSIWLVDLIFKDASFCQYVCPVGQFNFLASSISPFEVRAKDTEVCRKCTTFECIKGSEKHRGCELKLFLPKKNGNLDCTFCMDCEKACPHQNVTIGARFLKEKTDMMAIWSRRDLAFLTVVFTFGGLLNAFAMVNPAYEAQRFFLQTFSISNEVISLTFLFVLFLIIVPFVFLSTTPGSRYEKKALISSLLPLGFAVWLAHYCFHFFTGIFTFVPIIWRSLPVSQPGLGFWAEFPMGVSTAWVMPIQIGIIILGLVGSFLAAQTVTEKLGKKWLAAWPWYILFLLIAVFAIWTFSLPMEMRGTVLGA